MKVLIDPAAGPCGGVRRAIKMVEKGLQDNKNIVAIGSLIHNDAEVKRLSRLGLETVPQEAIEAGNVEALKGKRAFIRSHGVSAALSQRIKENAGEVLDGSCPKVVRIQKLIEKQYKAGRQIIIIGKPGHPEVVGLNGHCHESAIIVSSDEDLKKIDPNKPSFLVAQTTISSNKFIDLKEKIVQIVSDLLVKDTLCSQVSNRHNNLRNFAASVNVLLLVGGKKSSNTRALYELAKAINNRTYWIEQPGEVEDAWLDGQESVGITGSASTPLWQLEEVKRHIEGVAPVSDFENPPNGI